MVIGLDGGTFKTLLPLLESGDLSYLSELFKNGVAGRLEVPLPTLSPLVWACFYTGKNPGKLGIFALSHVDDLKNITRPKLFTAVSIKTRSIWGILSENKKKVGVVNIPATYPPGEVNGFIISGLLTPRSSKDYYYPPELMSFLHDYRIDLDYDELPDKLIDKRKLLRELYDMANKRVEVICKLIENYDLDCMIVDFKENDNVQHLFWNDLKTLMKFYQFMDTNLKLLHSVFNPTHVIIMSDHGFHEAESEYFYINSWLERKGYLKRASGLIAKSRSVVYDLALEFFGKRDALRSLIPESIKHEAKADFASRQINFQKSDAYGSMWGVYIADKIRASRAYPKFRTTLKMELQKVMKSSNNYVFEEVYEREQLYSGKYVNKFPDLIPVPNPRYLINPNLSRHLFGPRVDKPYLEGAHKSDRYGIFIAYGEGIKKGVRMDGIKITDLAPTILYLCGVSVPNDMDGKVLAKIFEDWFVRKNPVRYYQVKDELAVVRSKKEKERVLTKEDEKEIKERLRALGYLE